MTRAAACALLAGIAGAFAVADLAAGRAPRARRPTNARTARGERPGSAEPRLRRLMTVLAGLGRRLGAAGAPGDLAALVAAAGTPLGLAPADVMAVKGAGALVGGLAGLPLAAAAPGRLGIVALVAAPAAGFLVPDAWLRRRAGARGAAMARELPDVVDLLRVAVEAGLPVTRALADVGHRHPGALAAELRAAATAIELGMPRADVLRSVPRRAPLPAVG
ncbi:MAG TPA: type II secretion system F family protein, partial [Solirubrobacteraceae bacterium]